MAAIKPVDQASEKWSRRAAVAGEDYRAGVANPRTPWDQAAVAADSNYRQGVTAAANAGRYSAGVRRVGVERWRNAAQTKGPQRFAEGVALSVGEWTRGFQPYHTAISNLNLPARGPAGSPQNLQRVQAIATALRAVREGASKR